MPDTAEGRERLVKLEVQLQSLREQHNAHAQETKIIIGELVRKVEELTAVMNKGKGAFAFTLVVAGIVGGFITNSASALFEKIGG